MHWADRLSREARRIKSGGALGVRYMIETEGSGREKKAVKSGSDPLEIAQDDTMKLFARSKRDRVWAKLDKCLVRG